MIENIPSHPRDISSFAAKKLKINRRTAIDYLHDLVKSGEVSVQGRTRARVYVLGVARERDWKIAITPTTQEDEVWRREILPEISGTKENVRRICQHGFTEMLNNAIDHSGADHAAIHFERKNGAIWISIRDNGIGIFERLKESFGLSPEEAVLELEKGKLTTNPERHSGEGIFFTSKMFDAFCIRSRGHGFSAGPKIEALPALEDASDPRESGTLVSMLIREDSPRRAEDVFAEFADEDDLGFVRTRIPMKDAKVPNEDLLSRSQAKRVMARTEAFKAVILDFTGVSVIGQAFADEIFRVYKGAHPEISVAVENASDEIRKMIARAGASAKPDDAR